MLQQPSPTQFSRIKATLFVVCLFPLARLAFLGLTDGLGANPIEFITRSTGTWTLVFLLVVLTRKPPQSSGAYGTAAWATTADLAHMTGDRARGIIVGHVTSTVTKWQGIKALFSRSTDARTAVRTCITPFWRRQPPLLVRLTDSVHTAIFAPSGAGKNGS